MNRNKNKLTFVVITDLLGNVLTNKNYSLQMGMNKLNLNTQQLNAGTYFVKVLLGDYTRVQKIIKRK